MSRDFFYSVLVVDDEPVNIRIVAEHLHSCCEVLVATSARFALTLLDKKVPDLILLDILMPEINGFDLAKIIKADRRWSSIPIIFLTSDTSKETILEALRIGAVDFIIKPFEPEELLLRVNNCLNSYMVEKKLKETLTDNTRLLSIVDCYVPYIKVDNNAIITGVSSQFCEKFSCVKDKLIGQHTRLLKSGNTPDDFYKKLWESLNANELFQGEIEDKNFNGSTNWYHVTISPETDEHKNIIGYIAFYENIDERIQLKHTSETDKLTGLANRLKLDHFLIMETERSNRYNVPLSIILIDIDHFKMVNDDFGHQVGDIVLKEVAEILKNNIRVSDFVARWGGEEFIIVCTNSDQNSAFDLADKLRSLIERYAFSVIGCKTASFGVAQYNIEEKTTDLFKKVDDALYRAKDLGRNRVELAG